MNCTVAIIGGGLFGSGLALELARKGIAVTLIDRDAVPVNRAARRNEGKVHLGFVYAQEDDARTAAVMIEGALAFRRSVASWIGNEAWRSIPSSTPYHYLIHRDSILDATRLALHYAAVQRLYEETAAADPQGVDYLGDRPPSLWRPLDSAEVSAYRRASVQSGFATVERALDTDSLCDQLAAVVSALPAIRWVGGTHVEGVTNTGKGFEVYGRRMGDRWAERFDFVVNAAWTSRVAIDQSIGILHTVEKGYLSVDQGKWTTAPLFAVRVGEMVARMAGVGND